jgi:hypothetical protein
MKKILQIRQNEKDSANPRKYEDIFVSYWKDQGLISRMYKVFKTLNIKTTNNPVNKWANKVKRQSSE